jgi:thiazole/oxazole-forming peptide maturase SagD family component
VTTGGQKVRLSLDVLVQSIRDDEIIIASPSRINVFHGASYGYILNKLTRTRNLSEIIPVTLDIRQSTILLTALDVLIEAGVVIVEIDSNTEKFVQIFDFETSRNEGELLRSLISELLYDPARNNSPTYKCLLVSSYRDMDLSSWDVPIIPVKLTTQRVTIGPLFEPSGELADKVLKRLVTAESDLSADWDAVPLLYRTLSMARAAHEIRQLINRRTNNITPTNCISVDFETMIETRHQVRGIEPPLGTQFRSWADLEAQNSGSRLADFQDIVDPVTGIVQYVQIVRDDPVFVSATFHDGGSHQSNRLYKKNQRFGSGGKGATADQAIASCLGEAIERYCCTHFSSAEAIVSSESELIARGENVIDVHTALGFSERQYSSREDVYDDVASVQYSGFNWTPPRYNRDAHVEWRRATSLPEFRPLWVPSAMVMFDYQNQDEPIFCKADSNGCASGATLKDAITHSLLELVERDACGIWWYNQIRRRGIEVASASDNFVSSVYKKQRALNRSIDVIEITTDLDIPVCAAISSNSDGGQIHIGLGASGTVAGAARRALAEMEQVATVDVAGLRLHSRDRTEADLAMWYKDGNLREHPQLTPTELYQIDWTTGGWPARSETLEFVLEKISSAGLTPYFIDLTRPSLPLHVVRSMVPGLCHFWRRMASKRLYDVPVLKGWLPAPKNEGQLNPVAFFL